MLTPLGILKIWVISTVIGAVMGVLTSLVIDLVYDKYEQSRNSRK